MSLSFGDVAQNRNFADAGFVEQFIYLGRGFVINIDNPVGDCFWKEGLRLSRMKAKATHQAI